MPNRSPEREQFLWDIVTTAVEGGIGYWSQCSEYQWVDTNGKLMRVLGEPTGEGTYCIVHELNDDESDYKVEGIRIDAEVVAKGIGLFRRHVIPMHKRLFEPLVLADSENDAGEIDADLADVIVQAGLFDEVRYG